MKGDLAVKSNFKISAGYELHMNNVIKSENLCEVIVKCPEFRES
jgi:hypothetical protein